MQPNTKHLGLKRLRKQTGPAPTFDCYNCKCKRYSPCTCMKKSDQPEKPAKAE
jgi:hypothetical protein